MKNKMKAAVVVQFGKPLEFQEWDVPTPGPGQILVKTEACGVCHTDLHAARGDLLARLDRPDEARAEFERAAAMTANEREKALLLERARETRAR